MTKRDDTVAPKILRDLADAAYWLRREEWELHDAALLFIGADPRSGLDLEALSSEEKGMVAEIVELAHEADGNGITVHPRYEGSKPYGVVEPRQFLIWAWDKFDREPPNALQPLTMAAPSRRQLEQRIAALEEELRHAAKFDDGVDHYPPELDIAMLAWRAVHNGYHGDEASVPKRLRSWIEENYATDIASRKLTDEALQRIATVANWDKTPGKKSGRRK